MATANKVGAALASVGLLTDVDTAQRNPLGMIQQDDAGGEYIYLSGVGSMLVGDWVFYDELWATTRAVTSSVGGPLAVAVSAVNATTSFGWFAVRHPFINAGVITGAGTFLDDTCPFITSTAGAVDDESSGAGSSIYGAISRESVTASTLLCHFQIVYPFNLGLAPV
jgi:hypothetical protein